MSNQSMKSKQSSRKLWGLIALLMLTFGFHQCSQPATDQSADEQQLFIGDDIALAQTEYGKVKGFILRDIYQFRGIPYGDNTAGENRFMPPKAPKAWEEILPAVWWGNTAPQMMEGRYGNAYASFVDHWNYDDVSEDCLKLNIWTPAIDKAKRPVLVWLHGGGYTNGNGIEQDGYDGENLSRKGNIVFVSINHRLGPMGFSDFSGIGGDAFKYSGNAGVLDMIFALEWVSRNIENFGGDPANVTIMGQSGGGAKVCNLMASPKAQGLVHKAVPLSGSTIQSIDPSYSRLLGEYILKEAGLKAEEITKLQQMPWLDYIQLANAAARKCAAENPGEGRRGGFGPVADGEILPAGKYFADAYGPGSSIPMMICTTFHEWNMSRTNASMENMTMDELKDQLSKLGGWFGGFGEKAPAIVEAYAKAFPDKKPVELMALITSNRKGVIETCNAKANQPAEIYLAWFGWEPPLFDGRMRAFHCLDISFWFNNTDLMLTHSGGGKRPRELSGKMSDALLNFMKTGNPNGGALPQWPAYTVEHGETMILNDVSEVKNDPDREARAAL
ncbi:MAG: carboxylesterase/lipase family protein [Prolixibacteraceae bacterium]|nr:carboxylesterase/lipase family protein [Prolixibacteraceae bacterium]